MGARLDFSSSIFLRRERATGRKEYAENEGETQRDDSEEERPRMTENQSFNERKSRWEISCDDDSIDTINF